MIKSFISFNIIRLITLITLLVIIPYGNGVVNGQTITRFTQTIPSGTALPGSCAPGDTFYLTVAPTGIYICGIAGSSTWVLFDNLLAPVSGVVVDKVITGIANATATTIATITIPNTATGALITVDMRASLGAGGAVGAFEATTGRTFLITLTRVPGVNTVGTITIFGIASSAAVPGATTISLTVTLSAVSGGAGATQTINIQANVARGAGSSTNHIVAASIKTIGTDITIQ